jgi:hypothetical protein
MKNTPYVKEYDNMGNVKNPIPTGYFHNFPNRKERREPLYKPPFFGCGKNEPLTVIGIYKYLRYRQVLLDTKTKILKTIEHYLPIK